MPKKTLETALKTDTQLVVQVKDNQKNLLEEIKQCAQVSEPESHFEDLEKNRNRIEKRVVDVFDVSDFLIESQAWKPLISGAVRVSRETQWVDHKTGERKTRSETAYYLCTHTYTAQEACTIIREHWHCENRNHHVRDVTLGEDRSRIRTQPGVFARLRSFALNVLRFDGAKNIRGTLFENSMDFEGLLGMKGILS